MEVVGSGLSCEDCKVNKEKVVRKDKIILLLKHLLQVKDKHYEDTIKKNGLLLRFKGQEDVEQLRKELSNIASHCTTLVEQQKVYRKTIEDIHLLVEEKSGVIAHLEFQNKQLYSANLSQEKELVTLKESIKGLEKKNQLSITIKPNKKRLKTVISDEVPSPEPETSKLSFSKEKSPAEDILTPASSVASSVPAPDDSTNPDSPWIDSVTGVEPESPALSQYEEIDNTLETTTPSFPRQVENDFTPTLTPSTNNCVVEGSLFDINQTEELPHLTLSTTNNGVAEGSLFDISQTEELPHLTPSALDSCEGLATELNFINASGEDFTFGDLLTNCTKPELNATSKLKVADEGFGEAASVSAVNDITTKRSALAEVHCNVMNCGKFENSSSEIVDSDEHISLLGGEPESSCLNEYSNIKDPTLHRGESSLQSAVDSENDPLTGSPLDASILEDVTMNVSAHEDNNGELLPHSGVSSKCELTFDNKNSSTSTVNLEKATSEKSHVNLLPGEKSVEFEKCLTSEDKALSSLEREKNRDDEVSVQSAQLSLMSDRLPVLPEKNSNLEDERAKHDSADLCAGQLDELSGSSTLNGCPTYSESINSIPASNTPGPISNESSSAESLTSDFRGFEGADSTMVDKFAAFLISKGLRNHTETERVDNSLMHNQSSLDSSVSLKPCSDSYDGSTVNSTATLFNLPDEVTSVDPKPEDSLESRVTGPCSGTLAGNDDAEIRCNAEILARTAYHTPLSSPSLQEWNFSFDQLPSLISPIKSLTKRKPRSNPLEDGFLTDYEGSPSVDSLNDGCQTRGNSSTTESNAASKQDVSNVNPFHNEKLNSLPARSIFDVSVDRDEKSDETEFNESPQKIESPATETAENKRVKEKLLKLNSETPIEARSISDSPSTKHSSSSDMEPSGCLSVSLCGRTDSSDSSDTLSDLDTSDVNQHDSSSSSSRSSSVRRKKLTQNDDSILNSPSGSSNSGVLQSNKRLRADESFPETDQPKKRRRADSKNANEGFQAKDQFEIVNGSPSQTLKLPVENTSSCLIESLSPKKKINDNSICSPRKETHKMQKNAQTTPSYTDASSTSEKKCVGLITSNSERQNVENTPISGTSDSLSTHNESVQQCLMKSPLIQELSSNSKSGYHEALGNDADDKTRLTNAHSITNSCEERSSNKSSGHAAEDESRDRNDLGQTGCNKNLPVVRDEQVKNSNLISSRAADSSIFVSNATSRRCTETQPKSEDKKRGDETPRPSTKFDKLMPKTEWKIPAQRSNERVHASSPASSGCRAFFDCQGYPSFADLKPDSWLDAETDQNSLRISQSSGEPRPNFKGNVGVLSDEPIVPSKLDDLVIGHLCWSVQLLSLTSSSNCNTFRYFTQAKSRSKKSNCNRFSASCKRVEGINSNQAAADRNFTAYRDSKDKLNPRANNSITVEIKEEDSPFSLKWFLPKGGNSIQPVLNSLCHLLRESASTNSLQGSSSAYREEFSESPSILETNRLESPSRNARSQNKAPSSSPSFFPRFTSSASFKIENKEDVSLCKMSPTCHKPYLRNTCTVAPATDNLHPKTTETQPYRNSHPNSYLQNDHKRCSCDVTKDVMYVNSVNTCSRESSNSHFTNNCAGNNIRFLPLSSTGMKSSTCDDEECTNKRFGVSSQRLFVSANNHKKVTSHQHCCCMVLKPSSLKSNDKTKSPVSKFHSTKYPDSCKNCHNKFQRNDPCGSVVNLWERHVDSHLPHLKRKHELGMPTESTQKSLSFPHSTGIEPSFNSSTIHQPCYPSQDDPTDHCSSPSTPDPVTSVSLNSHVARTNPQIKRSSKITEKSLQLPAGRPPQIELASLKSSDDIPLCPIKNSVASPPREIRKSNNSLFKEPRLRVEKSPVMKLKREVTTGCKELLSCEVVSTLPCESVSPQASSRVGNCPFDAANQDPVSSDIIFASNVIQSKHLPDSSSPHIEVSSLVQKSPRPYHRGSSVSHESIDSSVTLEASHRRIPHSNNKRSFMDSSTSKLVRPDSTTIIKDQHILERTPLAKPLHKECILNERLCPEVEQDKRTSPATCKNSKKKNDTAVDQQSKKRPASSVTLPNEETVILPDPWKSANSSPFKSPPTKKKRVLPRTRPKVNKSTRDDRRIENNSYALYDQAKPSSSEVTSTPAQGIGSACGSIPKDTPAGLPASFLSAERSNSLQKLRNGAGGHKDLSTSSSQLASSRAATHSEVPNSSGSKLMRTSTPEATRNKSAGVPACSSCEQPNCLCEIKIIFQELLYPNFPAVLSPLPELPEEENIDDHDLQSLAQPSEDFESTAFVSTHDTDRVELRGQLSSDSAGRVTPTIPNVAERNVSPECLRLTGDRCVEVPPRVTNPRVSTRNIKSKDKKRRIGSDCTGASTVMASPCKSKRNFSTEQNVMQMSEDSDGAFLTTVPNIFTNSDQSEKPLVQRDSDNVETMVAITKDFKTNVCYEKRVRSNGLDSADLSSPSTPIATTSIVTVTPQENLKRTSDDSVEVPTSPTVSERNVTPEKCARQMSDHFDEVPSVKTILSASKTNVKSEEHGVSSSSSLSNSSAAHSLIHLGKFFSRNVVAAEKSDLEGPVVSKSEYPAHSKPIENGEPASLRNLSTSDNESNSGSEDEMVIDERTELDEYSAESTSTASLTQPNRPTSSFDCKFEESSIQTPIFNFYSKTSTENEMNVEPTQPNPPADDGSIAESSNPRDSPQNPSSIPNSILNFYSNENKGIGAKKVEPEAKKLIRFSGNKIEVRKVIEPESVVSCSSNVIAFSSDYIISECESRQTKYYGVPSVKDKDMIQNCLHEYFHHPVLSSALKKAKRTLKKINPRHFGSALCAYIGSLKEICSNGVPTLNHKKGAMLVIALGNGRLDYFEAILSVAEESMTPSTYQCEFNTHQPVLNNLSIFYAVLCLSQGLVLRAQSFIYDVLYGRHLSSFLIIYNILCIIPKAIRFAREDIGPLTYTIVYLIMKQGIYQSLPPRIMSAYAVLSLRKHLATKYGYSLPEDVTRDLVVEELFANVTLKGSDKAIVLLCKCQGYKWAYSSVTKYLYPVLDQWTRETQMMQDDEDKVIQMVRILGLISRGFAVSINQQFVKSALSRLENIIRRKPSLFLAEAVVEALFHFCRLEPTKVLKILSSWVPHDNKVTLTSVKYIKKITKMKVLNVC